MPRKTTITLDTDNAFEAALITVLETFRSKNTDYAGNEASFQNFYDQAYQNNSTPGTAVEHVISSKQSRLRVLRRPGNRKPLNEPIRDTVKDRAVYSVIAYALYLEGSYEDNWQEL